MKSKLIPTLGLVAALTSQVVFSAPAKPPKESNTVDTLTLSYYYNIANEHEDGSAVEIQSVEVRAYSDSDTNTITLMGCYLSKIETGQGFPYEYNYEARQISLVAQGNVIGRDQVQMQNLATTIARAKSDLKKTMPSFCTSSEGVSVTMQLKIVKSGRLVKSVVFLKPTKNGYVVDSPVGVLNIKDSKIPVTEDFASIND